MQTSGPIRQNADFHHDNDFGEVVPYRGSLYETTLDGKRCLLKTSRGSDANSFFLLRREYEVSCNLQHPNVLTPLKYAMDTPVGPAIVMEYVEGVSLTDFLTTSPSFSVRKRLLSEILEAVEYLHKKGLLHNDLKTDNIIVSTIGNHIRIIDFGYSETDAQYMTKRLGGTPEASAPEVLAGNTDIPSTSSSDIYSLGGIIAAVFPNRYAWIVKKCHKTEPLDRYQDVDTLRRAIGFVEGLRKGLLILTILILASYIVMTLFATQRKIYEDKYQSQLKHLETTVVRLQKDSAEIVKIERDIEQMYLTTKDTLENPRYVPFANFAFLHQQNWIQKVEKYKREVCPEKYHHECRTYLDKYLHKLNDVALSRPNIYESRDKGVISAEECSYYQGLLNCQKPYSPYPGH